MNLIKILIIGTVVSLLQINLFPAAAYSESKTKPEPEFVVQKRYKYKVTSVAVSPDGKYIVTGSLEETAKLWNIKTGKEIRGFTGHEKGIESVTFTPDGKYIVTGSDDRTARLWDIRTGKELKVFKGHKGMIKSVSVSSDGRYLATGSWDRTVRLWDIKTGKEIKKFEGSMDYIDYVCITPDGKYLVAGDRDNIAHLWGINTGNKIASFGDPHKNWNFGISCNSKYIVTSDENNNARLWDIKTRKEVRTFKGSPGNETNRNNHINCIVITPDGKHVIGVRHNKNAWIWNIKTGKKVKVFKAGEYYGGIKCITVSPDGKYLIGGTGNTACIWDIKSGKKIRIFRGYTKEPVTVVISHNGRYLATEYYGGTAILWDLSSGEVIENFEGEVHINHYRKYLAVVNKLNTATLWDINTGKRLLNFDGRILENCFDVTPDIKYLVTTRKRGDGTVSLYNLKTGKKVRTFKKGHTKGVEPIIVTPDGKKLITGSYDMTIRIWDIKTGKELQVFKRKATHRESRYKVANSPKNISLIPDGKNITVKSGDGAIRTWNINTGKMTKKFYTPPKKPAPSKTRKKDSDGIFGFIGVGGGVSASGSFLYARSIAITPDGTKIAIGHHDGTSSLWDLETEKKIKIFKGHSMGVYSIDISPERGYLVTCSPDNTTRIWDLNTGKEIYRIISLDTGWLAMTPEGYFDGSPEGLKNTHWTVGLQTYSVEAFSEGYYTPGLIPRLNANEKIVSPKLSNLSEGFSLPPLVKILSPAPDSEFKKEYIELTVTAIDQGGGIDEIRLYQNGKALDSKTRGIKIEERKDRKTITFNIILVDGKNNFRAIALSRSKIESNPDEINVILKGIEKDSTLHIFAVGVNTYRNPDLDLNFAKPDAEGLVEFFEKTPNRLFKTIKKYEIYDKNATKEKILAKLGELEKTLPQDVTVIYLAGHGDTYEDIWYFIPYELVYPERIGEVKKKGISSLELDRQIRKISANKVLIFMDACKSGGAIKTIATRGDFDKRKALSQLARSNGVHVISASTKNQLASELKELGHGVFTYTLLEALKGKADGNPKDGVVTVRELLTFIENYLPEITEKYRTRPQFPVINSQGMDFPITTTK